MQLGPVRIRSAAARPSPTGRRRRGTRGIATGRRRRTTAAAAAAATTAATTGGGHFGLYRSHAPRRHRPRVTAGALNVVAAHLVDVEEEGLAVARREIEDRVVRSQ